MTVADTYHRISQREFAEWLAYYRMDPFGEDRADIRSGVAACGLATMWADKEGARRLKPSQFMPVFDEQDMDDGRQSPEEMERVLTKFTQRGDSNAIG